jgi:hypothetical protein
MRLLLLRRSGRWRACRRPLYRFYLGVQGRGAGEQSIPNIAYDCACEPAGASGGFPLVLYMGGGAHWHGYPASRWATAT